MRPGGARSDPGRGFASDNCSGVHPEVLAAIAAANSGHVPAYGADQWTAGAQELFREHFGPDARALPVFNGSGANVVALAAVTRPWQAVICPATAHLHVDECGAPERVAGVKLITVETPDGKLTPGLLDSAFPWERLGDEHASQPRVVSISNSTELGTVYSPSELRALADAAHGRDLLLHVDGARIANAAVAAGTGLGELTTGAGADLLSFGGTKNGLLFGEAVVFLAPGLGREAEFVRKQLLQLASKMRFAGAQLEALLGDGLWERNAARANEMAARLGSAISSIEGAELAHPVQANAVFARLPAEVIERLEFDEDGSRAFYVWDAPSGTVRLMCSWDTTPEDVDRFAAALAEALGAVSSR
ncbi:MAG: beta-eliminating lyase-related protein [Solirubrobacterales bacterium]